ncbi:hypothetical protein Tco_0340612 [Tanacetum coccineum]
MRTRRSKTRTVTPFANSERQFRARREVSPALIHNIYSFYESESSESDTENVDIETLTLEQYLALDLNNTRRKITYPDNSTFEVKGQLLRELRKISFSGGPTDSDVEHISNVLEIASIFNAQESTLIQVFPLTLEGIAKRWFERTSTEYEGESLFDTWERFNDLLFKCPFHDLNDHQKVNTFYNGLNSQTRRNVDSNGLIPGLTASDALKSIQKLVEHSHKWHYDEDNVTTLNPLRVITEKLKLLNHEMEELKVDFRKMNIDDARKNYYAEIKSIRSSEISYDETHTKPSNRPTNLKDKFEQCLKESGERQEIQNERMKKIMITSYGSDLEYRTIFVGGFERAFASLFDQDVQTFTGTMLLNLDQLEKQLDKEEFQEIGSFNAFRVLMTRFQTFINSKLEFNFDEGLMICKYFLAYTRIEVRQFRDTLIQHMESVKKSIDERAQLKRLYDRMVNKRLMQMQESKIVLGKAVDADLVVMDSSRTESGKQDTSSSLGNYLTHVVDADIRPVNDQVPSAEVHLTAQHNVLANEKQHTDQSEPSYDTYLLEKVDSNTTPDSTNMSHRGGEIDQDAEHDQVKSPLLKAEFLKTNDMVEKEVYNELSNRFLQLEKHCISLEIAMQQKEESFQSNKPCKNQEFPEFREFFEINDLKAQLQAKTTLICNLKNQIKSVKDASNEAKVKNDIDVFETINIELEHSVTKLLAANEQLHNENEHLKKTYKELYDSIKKTPFRIKTIVTL